MILLTGVAGFIGAHVARELCNLGFQVLGIDNLNDSYAPILKRWRIDSLLGACTGFAFRALDITDRQAMRANARGLRFDAVINLAARAGVIPSVHDPWTYYETNLIGTLNLLEFCRESEIPKFVLASTSSAYGNAARPFRETEASNQPLSPYAASKKAAEELSYTYHHLYGLDVSVLRFFTVYGPAGRPDMSVYRFIHWISHGEPLRIRGDGQQERDYTFVGDVARGATAALKPIGYEVINLGSDRPAPLTKVIRILEDCIGMRAILRYEAEDPSDVRATWADIRKARELIGWEPAVPLEEGLRRTVEWHLANRELTERIPLP